MGMTIGEKIIARAAKVDQVKAGEIHTIEVKTSKDRGQRQTGIYHGPQCACGESKNSSST